MNTSSVEAPAVVAAPRPLRVWPALALLALAGVSQLVPLVMSDLSIGALMFCVFMPLLAGLGILLWWALLSRATARERLLGPLAVLLVAGLTFAILHPSMQGMGGSLMFFLPAGLTAVGVTLVLLRRARPSVRLWGAVAAGLVGFAGWNLVRNEGVSGDFKSTFAWRWTPTAEQLYLANLEHADAARVAPVSEKSDSAMFDVPAWPGFRGANRDGIVPGVVLATDWTTSPPKEIWRRQVGPGWSSFAVAGQSLFTQEQRGDVEVVVSYDTETGAQRWVQESPVRFWEAIAGAGPRSTPTLARGRLFTVGATGLIHCLDPSTGQVIWQRDLNKDAAKETPTWGYSSSPLVVGDAVIVYAGGTGDNGVLAYDFHTGERRWGAAAGDQSYSSPHLASVGGKDVVLMLTSVALAALDPIDGTPVWTHTLDKASGETGNCLQPLVLGPTDIVYGSATDTRRIALTLTDDAPQIKNAWTSQGMKGNFNDYVAHRGSLYGFDGNIFACVDLETGKRHWKKGRYGNGQVLLLPAGDQMLVVSETGDLALLHANDKQQEELATVKILTGKTWNHPVLVANRLYLRNGEEAVCLELPLDNSNN